jgi:hypothetical protein
MQQRPSFGGEQTPSQQLGKVLPQASPRETHSGGSAAVVVVGAPQVVPRVHWPPQQTPPPQGAPSGCTKHECPSQPTQSGLFPKPGTQSDVSQQLPAVQP